MRVQNHLRLSTSIVVAAAATSLLRTEELKAIAGDTAAVAVAEAAEGVVRVWCRVRVRDTDSRILVAVG